MGLGTYEATCSFGGKRKIYDYGYSAHALNITHNLPPDSAHPGFDDIKLNAKLEYDFHHVVSLFLKKE